MTLKPDPAQPGLWVNPQWTAAQPGTFAVIAGVSEYKHLGEGAQPAANTYDLGQLAVSALTAHEVFRWLSEDYQLRGVPLACCWLLLSPTQAELKLRSEIGTHAVPATFAELRNAIGWWFKTMKDLPPEIAAQSRAFFFFSGHGLEIHQDHHVLLPADYLHPPVEAWDEAVSTSNLRKGLASLNVPHQLFFLDACRNGSADLRKKVLTGQRILNEDESAALNPALVAPILYATASGQRAFQQPDPGKGYSVFGTALLDGLAGKPDMELKTDSDLQAVNLYPLQAFLKQKTINLLAKEGMAALQPVKLSGIVDNLLVTLVEPPGPKIRGGFGRFSRRPTQASPPSPGGEQRAAAVEHEIDRRFTSTLEVTHSIDRELVMPNFAVGHEVFGSEYITEVWSAQRLRLIGLSSSDREFPREALVIHQIAHDSDTRQHRIEIAVREADPAGYWLQLRDQQEMAWSCILPGHGDPYLRGESARFLVEMENEYSSNGRRIVRMSANLSNRNPASLRAAAELWRRYTSGDVSESIRAYQEGVRNSPEIGDRDAVPLQRLLHGKQKSPLAAVVASLVLLRANRLDLVQDWVRNLANWFPDLPDGAVLLTEHLMRSRPLQRTELFDQSLIQDRLARGRLPFTGASYAFLTSILDRLEQESGWKYGLDRTAVATLRERVNNALAYLQPGGLFAVFSGFDPKMDPRDLLGPVI